MNRILHNTQWVIGAHAHMQILVGLSCTLFAALYAIFPMVTHKEVKSKFLTNLHFWCQMVGGIGMSVSMGFAGLAGMLRRTLYLEDSIYLRLSPGDVSGSFLRHHLDHRLRCHDVQLD